MINDRYIENSKDGVFQGGHYGWFYRIKGRISKTFKTEEEATIAFVIKFNER